jgi:hypothetical protein
MTTKPKPPAGGPQDEKRDKKITLTVSTLSGD